MLERRNGLARGIYNRLHADGRFVDRAILNEVQYRLRAMLQHWGFSAYHRAFEPDPVELYSWQDHDADLDFSRVTSCPNRKLRDMAQDATQTDTADSKLRQILDRNPTFGSTDVATGDSVIFYEQISR